MCVIAFSPRNNDMPTEKQIKEMFEKNPDGAGYAWDDGNTVHFKKGFMTVDDLLEDLGPLEKWKNKNIAIHFRIGTAGKNDKKTTHPFPLTNNFGDMRKLQGDGPVLFHNGVISGYGGIIDPLASDTQDFVAGVASKLLTRPNAPSKITEKTIDTIIGSSRLLIMYGKNKIVKFGDWKTENGNFYSNLLWKPHSANVKTYQTYSLGKYDGYYDYDIPHESEYAWPSEYHQWIKVTPTRGQQILKQSELKNNGTYKFVSTRDLEWKTNENNTEWWTTKLGEQMKSDYEEEEQYESIFETNYQSFETTDEQIQWLADNNAIVYKDNTAEILGQTWYIDQENCECFTEDIAQALTDVVDVDKALEVLKITGHLPLDEEEMQQMILDNNIADRVEAIV